MTSRFLDREVSDGRQRVSSSKAGSSRKGGSSSKAKASSKGKASSKASASSKARPSSKAGPHKKAHALTSGWLRVDGVNGGPRFHFFGQQFFLAGSGADAGNCRPQQCLPCQKGTFSVESQFAGNNTFGIGPSIVNNQYYETISYAGSLHIVGQGKLSDTRGSTDSRKSRAIVLAPFTISGNLVGLDGPEGIQDNPSCSISRSRAVGSRSSSSTSIRPHHPGFSTTSAA